MMEKVSLEALDVTEKVRKTSSETFDSLRNSISNIKASDHGSSDDEDAPRIRCKKRAKRFSDSDSDSGREKTRNENMPRLENHSHSLKSTLQNDSSESDINISERTPHKSRLQRNGNLSDSEMSHSDNEGKNNKFSDSEINISNSIPHKSRIERNLSNSDESVNDNAVKNKPQQLRMKNKRNNLQNKFKSLVTSRGKEQSYANIEVERKNQSDSDVSESGEEMSSIEKIKQKIKERMTFKPSICDPDTSDEETSQRKPIVKPKERKMTKLTSPKPQRMSAKQAMENMQKIKSESNRMLREKEVSLPYHRPKALSLKDIMSRRKPAVGSDGKALPIKMNEQQLKQYVEQLQERQKEMMELCKSESEEEENNEYSIEKDTEINKTNNDETNSAVKNINNTINIDNSIKLNGDILKEHCNSETVKGNVSTDKDIDELPNEQDSETSMKLVYNDSANSVIDDQLTNNEEVTISEYQSIDDVSKNIVEEAIDNEIVLRISKSTETCKNDNLKHNTEVDSQSISLHFDSEKTDYTNNKNDVTEAITKAINEDIEIAENTLEANITSNQDKAYSVENEDMEVNNDFSDDEMSIADIDDIIANAEIIKDIEDKVNSQFLVRDKPLNLNPKLTGSPGMVIDLDDSDPAPKKSGIELLKERFTYFSKLKTPEEMERDRETKVKPGTQLNKLKHQLEEQIAEQRSIEWAKRLEDEKQHQNELKELRGEESEDDDIDKIEAALEGKEEDVKEGSEKAESDEEEPIEDDIDIRDKPRVKNAMLDDEAEESDCDEVEDKTVKEGDIEQDNEHEDSVGQDAENEDDDGIDGDNDDDEENVSESDDSDESSESEEEQPSTMKRGRILKAFEDSDEEDADKLSDLPLVAVKGVKGASESKSGSSSKTENFVDSQVVSQDEELPLAQIHKSASDDLFTSQESALLVSQAKDKSKDLSENDETFTQSFSILDSTKQPVVDLYLNTSGKMSVVCNTQSSDVRNEDDISGLCPLTDSQNNLPLPSQMPITQLSQSQPIGEDILALCTGQFYNNQFVSQLEQNLGPLGESQKYEAFDKYLYQDSQESPEQANAPVDISKEKVDITDTVDPKVTDNFIELHAVDDDKENRKLKTVDDNLKSILDELADPEFDSPKPNKFFVGSKNVKKDTMENENQVKKKFIIDSDDETNAAEATESKKRKKFKKKKPEKRALQISDDEEEMLEEEEIEEYESDIEEENPDRLVEYDSEENEIAVKPQNPKKKRKKMTEFFENEAELTSEDEWVGSGDEDEAGLDRMEREEGDDETFHQGKLQRELGQIHMRDVLDQDKREVRLIQELLFEDGDLGDGGRQRKFRWNNMDGEEPGTVPDNFTDTQEEEFESEEQWRKQRHERETFLRQMQNKDGPDESLNVSINRSTIIKANLLSRTMSSLLEANVPSTEKTETSPIEKKTAKEVPSPKKPFALLQFQQSYQGSLLSRGRGALARLAALATPLAADDDAKVGTLGPSNRRNFVFAALTPEPKEPKVTKRKADSNPITPKLVKKMRTEDKQNTSRNSLLDHFKV